MINPLHEGQAGAVELKNQARAATNELKNQASAATNELKNQASAATNELKNELENQLSEATNQAKAQLKEATDICGQINKTIDSLHENFVANIPNDMVKSLQANNKRLYYVLGVICYLILLGIFVSFFSTGIQTAQQTKFISIDQNSGECELVGTTLSSEQYASTEGAWMGFRRFKYQQAAYLFTFEGYIYKYNVHPISIEFTSIKTARRI